MKLDKHEEQQAQEIAAQQNYLTITKNPFKKPPMPERASGSKMDKEQKPVPKQIHPFQQIMNKHQPIFENSPSPQSSNQKFSIDITQMS